MLKTFSDLSWGKYESPMCLYVFERCLMVGDNGDEDCALEGDWANRYGRRILRGDDRGFVALDTYKTVEEAKEAYQEHELAIMGPVEDEGDSDTYTYEEMQELAAEQSEGRW